MVILEHVVFKDICLTDRKYIMHQTNCVTTKAHGLSAQLFRKFPHGDIYTSRNSTSNNTASIPDKPGTVSIKCGTTTIINVMGQWAPGKPSDSRGRTYQPFYLNKYANKGNLYACQHTDSKSNRVDYFKSAIKQLEECEDINRDEVIAVPVKIGCGLAGGDWNVYKQILENSKLTFELYQYTPKCY